MPRSEVASFQIVEYLRAFLFGRLGWNRLGGNLIISGAFGLFRRETVVAAGGYLHDTVGEDMELVLRLKRGSYENSKGGEDRLRARSCGVDRGAGIVENARAPARPLAAGTF